MDTDPDPLSTSEIQIELIDLALVGAPVRPVS
jgi:hypothetical protein